MKRSFACVLLGVTLACTGLAFADDGVQFSVVLSRDGKVVASPTFVGEFGKTLTVAISDTMRVEATAETPAADGASFTRVNLALFENGAMGPGKEMAMRADLSQSPSFEYSVPGTNARFVVMPRLVKLPNKG
jgi:hypothetical protein